MAEGGAKDRGGELERIVRTDDRGHEGRAAEGYACERTCGASVGEAAWTERVVVVRAPVHAARPASGFATRLAHAETQLAALTPPRGRGKRQSTAEALLLAAMDKVRKEPRVAGWLRAAWTKQVERKTQYVGRGRGAARREKRGSKRIRSHRTHRTRQEDHIAEISQRFGWKAFGTHAGQTRRSLQDAVVCSRNA